MILLLLVNRNCFYVALDATKEKISEWEDKSEEISQHEKKERKIDGKYREIE